MSAVDWPLKYAMEPTSSLKVIQMHSFVISTIFSMLFSAIFAEHIVIESPSNATTVAPGDIISLSYTVSPDAYAPIGSVRVDLAEYDAKTILYPNIAHAEWSDWHNQGGSVSGIWEVPEDMPSGWYHIIFRGVTGGHCTIKGTQKYRTCPGESMSSTMIYVD